MHLRLRFGFAFAALALAGACSASDTQPLFVAGVRPPAAAGTSMAGGCTANDSVFVVSGVLDLKLAVPAGLGYLAFAELQNRMLPNTTQNRGVDTNQIQVTGADLDIAFVPPVTGLAAGLTSFREPLYATVPSAGTAEIPLTLIPAATAAQIGTNTTTDTLATIKVRFIGNSNGSDLRSNDANFSVRLCSGCLINNIGPCCVNSTNLGLCNPVQDSAVDCCDVGNMVLQCPAKKLASAACADAGAP
jgi:hypothetical protein